MQRENVNYLALPVVYRAILHMLRNDDDMPWGSDAIALELMVKALEEEKDSLLREYVCWYLGRIGDCNAVEPLALASKDSSPIVRASATEALGKMTGSPRAFEALSGALEDSDKSVRAKARAALKKLRTVR